jgi:hypothetical protein
MRSAMISKIDIDVNFERNKMPQAYLWCIEMCLINFWKKKKREREIWGE